MGGVRVSVVDVAIRLRFFHKKGSSRIQLSQPAVPAIAKVVLVVITSKKPLIYYQDLALISVRIRPHSLLEKRSMFSSTFDVS